MQLAKSEESTRRRKEGWNGIKNKADRMNALLMVAIVIEPFLFVLPILAHSYDLRCAYLIPTRAFGVIGRARRASVVVMKAISLQRQAVPNTAGELSPRCGLANSQCLSLSLCRTVLHMTTAEKQTKLLT